MLYLSIRNGYTILFLFICNSCLSTTFKNDDFNHRAFRNKREDFCGPLPQVISELNACIIGGNEFSCPNHTKAGGVVKKHCSPFYSSNSDDFTSYTCGEDGKWKSTSFCRPECGKRRPQAMPLIVGGQETIKYEFPWVAALYTAETKLCSGTIISPYHVVTAAHCFTYEDGAPRNKNRFMVRVGKHYRDPSVNEASAQERRIKNLIVHEQYRGENDDGSFDIALMEVNQAFVFSSYVQPICVDWDSVYEDRIFVDGNEGIVTGWGFVEKNGPRSEVLRKVDVAFWTRNTCYNQLPASFRDTFFTTDKFCAGYINASKSICIGDAGAGLFFQLDNRYFLGGIATTMMASPEGCETNHYALYTKISSYLKWLKETMLASGNIAMELRTRINSPQNKSGCSLPQHVPFGKFLHLRDQRYIVNQVVPEASIIRLKCKDQNSEIQLIYCGDNGWLNLDEAKCNIPGTCASLKPTQTEDYACVINGMSISCEDPPYGTEAKKNCKNLFTSSDNIYRCEKGKWKNEVAPCVPECGIKTVAPTTLVIGGINATENEYPWVVAIYDFGGIQICGGTIISQKYVLSAAHCFANQTTGQMFDKDNYSVIAGKHNRDKNVVEEGTQERKIKSLKLHPEFSGLYQNFRDDIAIIQIEIPFIITPSVRPICIDIESRYEEFDFIHGRIGVIAGWGNTNPLGEPSIVLKKLEMPFVDKQNCRQAFDPIFARKYITPDKICAGYKNYNSNICNGDSGGGLYFQTHGRYYIRGIASLTYRSQGGCSANLYSLYTKVSLYIVWIKSITEGEIYAQYNY